MDGGDIFGDEIDEEYEDIGLLLLCKGCGLSVVVLEEGVDELLSEG